MNKLNILSWLRPAALLCAVVPAVFLAGCSSSQPEVKATHQRGWIGGEYKMAGRDYGPFGPHPEVFGFPKELRKSYKDGLLITALATNTPAEIAGLRTGDLVLEANHQPTPILKNLWAVIDRSDPGTLLPVKVYRNGEMVECNVTVGRETYWHEGTISIGPSWPFHLDLWPNPGFALIVLGFEPFDGPRAELGSAKGAYLKNCNGKYEPVDEDWNVWLVVVGGSKGKRILSQEIVPAQTASAFDLPRAGTGRAAEAVSSGQ